MFRKSLAAAFAAAALAGLMTAAAPARAETQAPAAPASPMAMANLSSLLRAGGPSLPLPLAGSLLAREGWAPIAMGDDGEASQMVVLRKQNTDTVRLVEVANGTLKITAEGVASEFQKPAGPFTNASFNARALSATPVDQNGQACMGDADSMKERLVSRAGQASVMKITTPTSVLEITSGLSARKTWAVIETKNGQSQTCLVNGGINFQISDIYPLAHWAPPVVAAPATPAPAEAVPGAQPTSAAPQARPSPNL
jgi:hypothetical protein